MKKLSIRFLLLIFKIISVKGLVFGIATTLMFTNLLNDWIWFATGVLLVSIRMFEKLINKLPNITN